MDERVLAERLVTYDTSTEEGCVPPRDSSRAGWRRGTSTSRRGASATCHALTASVGTRRAPTLVFHGHLDVVPGHPGQFSPRVEGDRLYGRGAYDMKGGLAAMMCASHDLADQDKVRVRLVSCPTRSPRTSTALERRPRRRGYVGDFAITGEPTDLHIGVQAKGVCAARLLVRGRAAHGSTPWLGDNAI